jgi:DEAD/DEAH box helicase domain-containing protein
MPRNPLPATPGPPRGTAPPGSAVPGPAIPAAGPTPPPTVSPAPAPSPAPTLPPAVRRLLADGARSGRLVHVTEIPACPARAANWPGWVPAPLLTALAATGPQRPWSHQAITADHARRGQDVIISTPAASGKSLAYLVPALTAVLSGGTALYLAPTRALAADQLRAVTALGLAGVVPAVVDGDTPAADRDRARARANYLLTTPDMLHHVLLPRHRQWHGLFGRLAYVIVDECHGYRGVFGSHVAAVLRRLRRVAAYHGAGTAGPVFLLSSATVAEPAALARLLTGRPAVPVTKSGAPRGPLTLCLWEPPLTAAHGEHGAPLRRAAIPEAADLLAQLVAGGVRVLAFARSRRGAEALALAARRALGEDRPPPPTPAGPESRSPQSRGLQSGGQPRGRRGTGPGSRIRGGSGPGPPGQRSPTPGMAVNAATPAIDSRSRGSGGEPQATGSATGLASRVAAYRSGYLAEDRRAVEEAVQAGTLLGLAATTALELGVNIHGLDAVLIAGWPGSRAALWQQAGRAGRECQPALAVLIARDDPLDTYLVHHPGALLGRPVETTVLDPENPHVLAPHLCAAAAELPLAGSDLPVFGSAAAALAADLVGAGLLRRRRERLYCTRRGLASGTTLRGAGQPVRIVEEATGRLVGTVDEPSAPALVHAGAVYPHQGEMYLVKRLELADRVALVAAGDPGYMTSAQEVTSIRVLSESLRARWGPASVHFGEVAVTRQVTSFVRRDSVTGQPLGEAALSLPSRELRTRAVWWTVSAGQRSALQERGVPLAGAAHAAEHTAIGLLPLFTSCDRMDIGGVSADLHPATGKLTVFVYDGQQGGAGFAERGFSVAPDWLRATAQAIASCACQHGCPSCIQSPQCGSGNEPLSKEGAVLLLAALLTHAPAGKRQPGPA